MCAAVGATRKWGQVCRMLLDNLGASRNHNSGQYPKGLEALNRLIKAVLTSEN